VTAEVVGPVRPIHFGSLRGGVDITYTPPGNTLDPRYAACSDHHVACDCREALWSENQNEWRMETDHQREVFDRFIGTHSTEISGSPNRFTGEKDRPCQCTGCQIYRAIHYYPEEDS